MTLRCRHGSGSVVAAIAFWLVAAIAFDGVPPASEEKAHAPAKSSGGNKGGNKAHKQSGNCNHEWSETRRMPIRSQTLRAYGFDLCPWLKQPESSQYPRLPHTKPPPAIMVKCLERLAEWQEKGDILFLSLIHI